MPSYFLDTRSKAWFTDSFANQDHEPIAVALFDGDEPGDRVVLLGSDDAYVRRFSEAVANDDGTAVESYVVIGPVTSGSLPKVPFVVKEIKAQLDVNSHSVFWELLVGDTPEIAIGTADSPFVGDGTLVANARFSTANPNVGGYYCYVKIGETSVTNAWSFENIKLKVSQAATSRGRSRSGN